MVRIDTVLESLVVACRQSSVLPDAVTYSTIVLDGEGAHSNVGLPVIEFSVDEIERDQSRNTEKKDVIYADDGTENGYRYESWFTATVTVEVTTAESTEYTHRGLETSLQTALYEYDTHGLGEQLPDPETPNEPLGDVCWLVYQGTNPNRDFGFNPSIRARESALEIGFNHQFKSTDYTSHDVVQEVVPNVDVSE